VTGFAHVCTAIPVGIVANNGILFSESAQKGAHFIELCCQRASRCCSCRTSPASWSARQIRGRRHRQARRQDGHRRRLRGRAEGHGDHRRLLRRRQLRHVRPRLRSALPVHLAERAHLRHGRRAGRQRARKRAQKDKAGETWSEAEEAAFKAPLIARYEKEAHAFYGSARLWDDGVIDPAQTRGVLALALSACLNRPIGETRFGVFRM
jgi:3-methylcrotonyl-CoA carboxylase beta subunit